MSAIDGWKTLQTEDQDLRVDEDVNRSLDQNCLITESNPALITDTFDTQ